MELKSLRRYFHSCNCRPRQHAAKKMLQEYSVIKLDAPWFYYRPTFTVHSPLWAFNGDPHPPPHRIALFAVVSPWSGLVGGQRRNLLVSKQSRRLFLGTIWTIEFGWMKGAPLLSRTKALFLLLLRLHSQSVPLELITRTLGIAASPGGDDVPWRQQCVSTTTNIRIIAVSPGLLSAPYLPYHNCPIDNLDNIAYPSTACTPPTRSRRSHSEKCQNCYFRTRRMLSKSQLPLNIAVIPLPVPVSQSVGNV